MQENIPGIYNYCDKWCEKCGFSDRCLLFFNMNMAELEADDNDDPMKGIVETMEQLKELMIAKLHEMGIDPQKVKEENAEDIQKIEEEFEAGFNHELTQMGAQYTRMVKNVLEIVDQKYMDEYVKRKIDQELYTHNDLEKNIGIINDNLELHWQYMLTLPGKLGRSAHNITSKDLLDNGITDSDGTAKVSVIMIDKAISAWENLVDVDLLDHNDILDVLAYLQKLRRTLLNYFPNAMSFVRPGFDEH